MVPTAAVLGLATSCTTGAAASTVTVTDWMADPPGPVQSSVKSVVSVRGPVSCEPLTADEPLQLLEDVQDCASVAFQVRVVSSPLAIVVAAALRMIVGASPTTVTSVWAVLVPLGPVQDTAKVVVSVTLGTTMVPFTGCGPLIPLVPSHDVAEEVCRTRLVLAPALIVADWGVREIAGPVFAALPVSQAASTAAEMRSSATRGTKTKIRLISNRVMSYPRFFFWVHGWDAASERRLGRSLGNII
jgi:hypothetical protein